MGPRDALTGPVVVERLKGELAVRFRLGLVTTLTIGVGFVVLGIAASRVMQHQLETSSVAAAWAGSVVGIVLSTLSLVFEVIGAVLIALCVAFRWDASLVWTRRAPTATVNRRARGDQ